MLKNRVSKSLHTQTVTSTNRFQVMQSTVGQLIGVNEQWATDAIVMRVKLRTLILVLMPTRTHLKIRTELWKMKKKP